MYNIGQCRICKQGLLEVVKDKTTGLIYICCDECEAEWNNPQDALSPQNGTRNKYGQIEYPSEDEIKKMKWAIELFEHNN